MTSSLRYQQQFTAVSAHNTASSYPHATAPPPSKKAKKMTVTQTYRLAHTARGKLSHEASRGDHDLRLLVGHANLLDSLMLDLQEAEKEQEAWFNATVRGVQQKEENSKQHVQWKDTVIAERELDIPDASDDSDSDSDSEFDESDDVDMSVPLRKIRSPPAIARSAVRSSHLNSIDEEEDDFSDYDSEDDFYEDDEDQSHLALVRTQSHKSIETSTTSSSPPELIHDSSDSEDEEMMSPSSPPSESISFPESEEEEKHSEHIVATPLGRRSRIQHQRKQTQIEGGQDDQGIYSLQSQPMISAY